MVVRPAVDTGRAGRLVAIAALRERFGGWAAPMPEVLAAVTDRDAGFFPHYRQAVPRSGAPAGSP